MPGTYHHSLEEDIKYFESLIHKWTASCYDSDKIAVLQRQLDAIRKLEDNDIESRIIRLTVRSESHHL